MANKATAINQNIEPLIPLSAEFEQCDISPDIIVKMSDNSFAKSWTQTLMIFPTFFMALDQSCRSVENLINKLQASVWSEYFLHSFNVTSQAIILYKAHFDLQPTDKGTWISPMTQWAEPTTKNLIVFLHNSNEKMPNWPECFPVYGQIATSLFCFLQNLNKTQNYPDNN